MKPVAPYVVLARLLVAAVIALLIPAYASAAAPTITEYPLPTPLEAPNALLGIATGPDGALWFTQYGNGSASKIGSVTTTGNFGALSQVAYGSKPGWITPGPNASLWFTEVAGNAVGQITTGGVVTEFPLPYPGAGEFAGSPFGIAAGPEGALWVANHGGTIDRVTTTGDVTEYPLPTANSGPWGMTSGPDGAMWFTEQTGNKIGRISTTGSISEFALPTDLSLPYGVAPQGITVGPDGALWFT